MSYSCQKICMVARNRPLIIFCSGQCNKPRADLTGAVNMRRRAGYEEMAKKGKDKGVARERTREKMNDLNAWSPLSRSRMLFCCGRHESQEPRPSHFKSRSNSGPKVNRNPF
ncbi:hypothetical protein RRG08_025361 [Elysia crispata]|uniref:Uncharacterized protein n=1 Tax=Elysia crispata TaxID=231223 RepID=A0AAE1B6A6_9GAST|nr:hypothetical protein RRG08_025361 [Elysia crispata]